MNVVNGEKRLNEAIKYLVSIGEIDGNAKNTSIAKKMGRGIQSVTCARKGDTRYFTQKFVTSFCAAFGNIISSDWILDGDGEMLNTIINEREESSIIGYTPSIGRPYYNVDFELGFDIMINDHTKTPQYMINFEPYNKCTCWCNAHGDSMHPTISSGDIIAIKQIDDLRCLINDEIYAIVTKNGLRTIKRVVDNGDIITLIPDNKEYHEQTIKKELLDKAFLVMGSVKKF